MESSVGAAQAQNLTHDCCVVCHQIVVGSLQILNKVGLALPFLVTLADNNEEMPSEEVRLRVLPRSCRNTDKDFLSVLEMLRTFLWDDVV